MGNRTYPIAIGPTPEWQRSDVILDNGWGNAAQWVPTAYHEYPALNVPPPTPTGFPIRIRISNIGPCGLGAPNDLPPVSGTPFPMQQNPCTFPNIYGSAVLITTEVEEAGADMFLNWVYWRATSGTSGFQNTRWRTAGYLQNQCWPSGCDDAAGASGDVRAIWMDNTLTAIFTQLGWRP